MGEDTPSALPESMTAYESRDLEAPGPGRVFGEFWWRSVALSVAGGCVVGFTAGPFVVFAGSHADRTLPVAISAAWVGAVVGAACGVVLGVPAGVVLGVVGATWLVPYRGKTTTNITLRLLAVAIVALWFPLLYQDNLYNDLTSVALWVVAVPGLVGAWCVAPWVAGWYVDRMAAPGVVRVPGAKRSSWRSGGTAAG